MSYIKSLRFKLMLLCVIPLFSCAFLFIAHSVVIANQVKAAAASEYVEIVTALDADNALIQAVRNVSLDLGWIAKQWSIFFLVAFVCFYIPITINIGKFIKPIRQMSNYADSLAEGNVDIEVIKDRTDELGVLQESFQRLTRASREQANLIERIAEGDLTGSYTPRSDIDTVGQSLVTMMNRNNDAMLQVLASTKQLSAATSQIAEGSQSLAQGTCRAGLRC